MGGPNQPEAVRANIEKRAPRFADLESHRYGRAFPAIHVLQRQKQDVDPPDQPGTTNTVRLATIEKTK